MITFLSQWEICSEMAVMPPACLKVGIQTFKPFEISSTPLHELLEPGYREPQMSGANFKSCCHL